jgi:hypothetical protein
MRQVSPECHRLMKWDDDSIREDGFVYLNSEHCSELWLRVYEDMVSSIKWMYDSRLLALYESWKEKNDRREKTMIEKIEKYCRENAFSRGVFLVGAAHRQPIIEISREQTAVDSTSMQWDIADWMRQVTRESGAQQGFQPDNRVGPTSDG